MAWLLSEILMYIRGICKHDFSLLVPFCGMKTHTRVRNYLFQDVNGCINWFEIVDKATTTIFVPPQKKWYEIVRHFGVWYPYWRVDYFYFYFIRRLITSWNACLEIDTINLWQYAVEFKYTNSYSRVFTISVAGILDTALGPCEIWAIRPKLISNSNLAKSHSSITSITIVQSFLNFHRAQQC